MNIISDFIKIINSKLTYAFIFALFIINSVLFGFLIGLHTNLTKTSNLVEVIQTEESLKQELEVKTQEKVIFGSSKGKYFYYKGCGGTTISAKNLVYYKSEAEAIAKGKVLYKSCE